MFVLRMVILFIFLPVVLWSAPYDLSGLKFKYFRYLFPPANHLLPSTEDYKFAGEWIRRKGTTAEDYQIKVKSFVYKASSHHLVYVKFKRHGMPFCWWFAKSTDGKPARGWVEGACDVDNDGVYEQVWDRNVYDKLHFNFCDYWNCESY